MSSQELADRYAEEEEAAMEEGVPDDEDVANAQTGLTSTDVGAILAKFNEDKLEDVTTSHFPPRGQLFGGDGEPTVLAAHVCGFDLSLQVLYAAFKELSVKVEEQAGQLDARPADAVR